MAHNTQWYDPSAYINKQEKKWHSVHNKCLDYSDCQHPNRSTQNQKIYLNSLEAETWSLVGFTEPLQIPLSVIVWRCVAMCQPCPRLAPAGQSGAVGEGSLHWQYSLQVYIALGFWLHRTNRETVRRWKDERLKGIWCGHYGTSMARLTNKWWAFGYDKTALPAGKLIIVAAP